VAAESPPVNCTERNALTDRIDEMAQDARELSLPPQGQPFAENFVQRGAVKFDDEQKAQFVERQNAAVSRVDQVFDGLLRGDGLDLDGLSTIADEALADLRDDQDLFVSLGINPHGEGYPARHSMHACMLAIAIGSHLKLDRETLKELGVGCLIHDSGMLMIDQNLASLSRRLLPAELLEISKHPVRIFDKMLSMQGISKRSAFVAYQMHERPDGSGYPRRRRKEQIHFLSRIAAVADVYVALASPRPHRPGILPYAALQTMVKLGQEGKLDPAAVQALVRTLSNYPLGSYVQLSDVRVGQVIRANDQQLERPVIEAWTRGSLDRPGDLVDLAAEQDLKIMGPLPSLKAPFDPAMCAPEAIQAAIHTAFAAAPKKAFQTYVTVYVPVLGGDAKQLSWRRVSACSRGVSSAGMEVFAREEIPAPLVVIAFNPRPGTRLCLKAQIDRRSPLSDGLWDYHVSFRGQVTEPQAGPAARC
jgi:HD-GYP domain-containing protein (c-di-GMP phosphodiesterase class II)